MGAPCTCKARIRKIHSHMVWRRGRPEKGSCWRLGLLGAEKKGRERAGLGRNFNRNPRVQHTLEKILNQWF